MAVGSYRQLDRQFADFESRHMQQCQAFKEKLVIAALDPVKQSGGYGIQTIKAESHGRIVWQPQQRPSQKTPQMGHKSSKQIPFPQTAFPLEPRSHHDVVGILKFEQSRDILRLVRIVCIEADEQSVPLGLCVSERSNVRASDPLLAFPPPQLQIRVILYHPGDDVAGAVRRIVIDDEYVRRQAKLE